MIPRIIHQIFLTGDLPAPLSRNVDDLINMNPGWEHRLYDFETALDDVARFYGEEMKQTVLMLNPDYGAARADILRHLLIHAWGGVYLDIKSTFVRPIDEVLREDDEYLLAQWHNGPGEPEQGFGLHPDLRHVPGGEYQTFHIIAKPQHGFSKAVIERIAGNIRRYRPWNSVGRMGVLRTTGPIAYTLAIHPILGDFEHRMASAEDLGLKWSLGDGYRHTDIFKKHYSQLSAPVVKMGPLGTTLSAAVEHVRGMKRSVQNGFASAG